MREIILTRWSIQVRDWLGSDTLRAMSAEAEALFLRLCIDQWERGSARGDKDLWLRAHGHRFVDFERAWSEATGPFETTESGLVHPRVASDRARCVGEIKTKTKAAQMTNTKRRSDADRTLSGRSAHAQRTLSGRSAHAQRTLMGPSASASASASDPETLPGGREPASAHETTAKSRKRRRAPQPVDPATVPLPAAIDTPAVRAELAAWVARRAEERYPPLGPVGLARVVAQLTPRGAAFAARAIGLAADKGWRGVRADWVDREDSVSKPSANGRHGSAPSPAPSVATSAAYERWTPPPEEQHGV